MQYDKIHYCNFKMTDCILKTYTPGTHLSPDYLTGLCLQTHTKRPQGGFYKLITGPFDPNMQNIGSWVVTESGYPLEGRSSLTSLAKTLYILTGTIFTSDYPIILPIGLHTKTLLQANASNINKPGCLVLGDNIPRLESNLSRALLIAYAALIAIGHNNEEPVPKVWVRPDMDAWRATIQLPRQEAISIYPPPDKV